MLPGCAGKKGENDTVSLSELKLKDVVNVETGRKLGKVMDIEFDACAGQVQAVVVPADFKIGSLFKGEKNGLVIPWERIVRIGDDVILVQFMAGDVGEEA